MAVAALSLGICRAEIKDVIVLGANNPELGTHKNVTSLSFAGDKMTVHALSGDKEYALADVTGLNIDKGSITGVVPAVTSDLALTASVSNGVLRVLGADAIQRVEVYSVTGQTVAAGKFNCNEAVLAIDSDTPVVIVRVTTAGLTKVLKLINR